MQRDHVEGVVGERKPVEWRGVELRLWNTTAREVDRLGSEIDAGKLREQTRVGGPAQVPSRATPGIEQAPALAKASSQER